MPNATMRRGSMRPTKAGLPLTALVALLVACATSSTAPKNSGGGGGGTPTGSLAVTITAPSHVAPTVTITGPNNYSKTLSATQTLANLPAGSYTITAGTGLTTDSIVSIGYSGTVTGSPATVTANGTASATVAYGAPWSSSGLLWVANAGGFSVSGYTSAQLRTTGAPAPAVSIGNGTSSSVVQGVMTLAVDQTGGVWMSDYTDTLYYFAAAQIAQSTNAAPHLKLVDTAMKAPTALTLDARGNLWVGDQTAKVFEFTSTQLATGGTVNAAVTLRSAFGSISRPYAMSFDIHGNLWLADFGDSSVVGFTPSQLATSGTPVPTLGVINTTATTNCIGLAFDANGDLWIVNLTDTLAEYTPDQLTSLGSPTAALSMVAPTIEEPGPMAFDNSGALWMGDYQKNHLLRFMPSQLTAGGSLSPAVTISASGGTPESSASLALPSGFAFAPHAAGLPSN